MPFQIQNYSVERLISVFSIDTGELVAELHLSSFDLVAFKEHFRIAEDDYDKEMIMEYDVAPHDVSFLSQYLERGVPFDFEKCAYVLSCYRAGD